ncbi:hypothetical protein BKP35_03810 [Anaerobacillus arseniciselenatis]|uniref:DUF1002 domain-containing protein n=1 Tax=Anaerobacillus arseniciselenatis TaxID=85682 RepID=A0A1S2LVB7_9BACI|nr:DUF1002 domain-containing protein [Anaerobacillus arseniciselenatis]OIJ16113.1 hypothetical protein BKP35_03810 [Anaerobacillus arseniciselenatis]
MKKLLLILLLSMFALLFPNSVLGDAVVGDVIVTLGKDLSEEQKEQLLLEMGVPKGVEVIYVSNEEEHQYLGEYISKQQIGTRAISSAKITLLDSGSGINVTTNNINWVAEGMYANALVTAGVTDAEIYVTAPFNVSGTGALTGIIKAYEITTEIEIPEEQKQVANEEMVRTAELGDRLGFEKATELMARIKEELAKNPVTTDEELRDLIQRVANELGITLTDEELAGLFSLFNRMKDLNIDWNQVQNQISKIRDNLGEILSREETQSFIANLLDIINELIDAIKGWFTKG